MTEIRLLIALPHWLIEIRSCFCSVILVSIWCPVASRSNATATHRWVSWTISLSAEAWGRATTERQLLILLHTQCHLFQFTDQIVKLLLLNSLKILLLWYTIRYLLILWRVLVVIALNLLMVKFKERLLLILRLVNLLVTKPQLIVIMIVHSRELMTIRVGSLRQVLAVCTIVRVLLLIVLNLWWVH